MTLHIGQQMPHVSSVAGVEVSPESGNNPSAVRCREYPKMATLLNTFALISVLLSITVEIDRRRWRSHVAAAGNTPEPQVA